MPGKWENFPQQNKEETEEALEKGIEEYAQEGIEELEEYLKNLEQGLVNIEDEKMQAKQRLEAVRGFGRLLFLKTERRREEGKEEIVQKMKEFAQNDDSESVREAATEILNRYYSEAGKEQ